VVHIVTIPISPFADFVDSDQFAFEQILQATPPILHRRDESALERHLGIDHTSLARPRAMTFAMVLASKGIDENDFYLGTL
jgi:hypothetical protein